jgi:hypothetical protein
MLSSAHTAEPLHQYRLFEGVLTSTHGPEPAVETEERFEKVLGRLLPITPRSKAPR